MGSTLLEGLTTNDDHRLAILWDKVGLGHNGQRLRAGDHIVVFLNDARRLIRGNEWEDFLDEQLQLLANRDAGGNKDRPILVGKMRLPSGKLTDRFDGPFLLTIRTMRPSGSGTGARSGESLSASILRWHRNHSDVQEGTTTFILSLPGEGLRSSPVTVNIKDGKVSPSEIVFDMEKVEK
jgi:hypothetical protein